MQINQQEGPAMMNQYPALTGDVVTERHTNICRTQGHATHTVDGRDSGSCPRCGDITESQPTSAQAVSRAINVAGFPTTQSHLREGIRVRRGTAKGSVSVRAEFDAQGLRQRRTQQVADALRGRGFVVELHTDGEGMTVTK